MLCYAGFSLFVLVTFYEFVSSGELPPPENPIYAREQKFLDPFKTDIEEALTCGQLIEYHGFKYEIHTVVTEDGYILQMYRIVNQASREKYGNQLVPVLLVHGFFTSCSSWLFNAQSKSGPSNSNDLGIALAYREFDVWLANNRGSAYSRNHTHLNSHDSEYWNFDWVDMGRYDDPAMVDYIRKVTDHEKIVYIGYSQGTMQILTKLAEDPAFANKLSLNILISPIAFYNNPSGIFGAIPNERPIYLALGAYVGPLPPFLPEFNTILTLFCTVPFFRPICLEVYAYLFGPDRKMVDSHHFPVLTSLLDTISAKCLLHDIQSIHFGQLRHYDYGDDKNLELYGSKLPPKFNFSNVPTHNLVLISGSNDYLAPPKNVQRLRNVLQGRPKVDHIIDYPLWSHSDIIFGNGAFEYAHLPIIDIIRGNIETPYQE